MVPGSCLVSIFVFVLDISKGLRQEWLEVGSDQMRYESTGKRSSGLGKYSLCMMKVWSDDGWMQ